MKKILTIVLAFGIIFALCACGNNVNTPNTDVEKPNNTQTSSKEEAAPKFEVTVTDEEGNAVKGVMVQLCKDTCVPAITDDNGVATFNGKS